tara:strand:- start:225 stop:401 length:177 start_codon:yes stop_codon:yes gene_type:complete
MMPIGLHLESGWTDKEREKFLDERARPDGFVFQEQEQIKKDQQKELDAFIRGQLGFGV